MKKYFTTNKELKAEISKLKEELELKTNEAEGYKRSCFSLLESSTAERVIQEILKRPMNWFDYTRLSEDEQRTYFKEAQMILKSKVFNNEMTAFILDLTNEIATKSRDFNEVLSLRAKICMGEIFRERLQKISEPEEAPKAPEQPHSTL